ncbi:hypothetical protein PF010_g25492 [Phytophthora fragariae]|uniref:Elicitin n=1 Tax=Phytophthora fragariae TaxID=53985 RepID=A0A6A3HT96_9STRA|nr:hypothetical protein PF003_g3783 [Phytophthora fragariae]KAE8973926.1 hypothetical protein PF011_g25058 [Phytophthora fragariae]KAE9072416.1 hypothetical protein PF010_g25492 [Phytophthora fragariae]KAE9089440.1 hypothetical protein PF006_g25356 [Phytophthora fragariae]
MRMKHLFSSWSLLLVVVAATELVNHGVVSDCNDSSLSMPEENTSEPSVAAGATSVNFSSPVLMVENVVTASSTAGASRSGESSHSIDFPETIAPVAIESINTEQPTMATQAPTQVPATAPTEVPTAAPVVAATASPATTPPTIATENLSDESSAATQGATQSTSATATPVAASASPAPISLENTITSTNNNDSGASESTDTTTSNDNEDGEPSIAHPASDSSTFQYVASAECSEKEVDNVYTLYSNCRSAFDLCVAASDYQIFPFQGNHPTQAQIQGMAESDACIAMFVIVIEANFSACTIGGMPLVSAVETLLKISVDLAKGLEDEAPSADVFKELLTWRYEVDLAKAAGVPHDGSSQLYAEFEANLNAALENSTIRVNNDLSVDVRLSNGSRNSQFAVASGSFDCLAEWHSPSVCVTEPMTLTDSSTTTMTSLLTLLLAFLVVQVAASGSGSLEDSVGSEPNATIVTPPTTAPAAPEVTLAPIDTASATSSTFQLVANVDCNETVSDKIYVIYNKNRALFDLCVSDAQYQIFPFLGTKPSAVQVEAMATSTSCDVVFTGVLLADFPQCQISGFPFKAAVETLLKIHVDLVHGWAASPSAERFQEMMSWRRYVNLAKQADVPCDSDSVLYAEYEENLNIARTNSSIRVLPNHQIEYKLASGSWYDADGEDYATIVSSTDSGDAVVGTVATGVSGSSVGGSSANTAPVVMAHGVATTVVSAVLGVLLLTA